MGRKNDKNLKKYMCMYFKNSHIHMQAHTQTQKEMGKEKKNRVGEKILRKIKVAKTVDRDRRSLPMPCYTFFYFFLGFVPLRAGLVIVKFIFFVLLTNLPTGVAGNKSWL